MTTFTFKFDPNDRSFANYIHFRYSGKIYNNLEEIKKEYEFIPQPKEIPTSAVREGTYAIRGRGSYQEVEHYKEFWVKKSLYKERIVSNAKWNLFPQLPDKEYEALNKIPRKVLNKEWALNIQSYLLWKELRKTTRDVRKTFISSKPKYY